MEPDTKTKPASLANWIELLEWRANQNPESEVFLFLPDGESEGPRLTFGELSRRARAIASALSERVTPGDPVLLMYPPGLDFITGFFGCLYAGAIAVPAPLPRSAKRSMPRLEAIVSNSTSRVVCSDSKTKDRLRPFVRENPALSGLEWFATNEIEASDSSQWSHPRILRHETALLQYTSGSTSTPKGVMITHQNLLHNTESIRQAFQIQPDQTFVGWLPVFHDMGLIGNVLTPIYCGIRGVLMPPDAFIFKPERWLKAISRYQASICGGPNFAYDLCVRRASQGADKSYNLSSWRLAFCGAEPIRPETLDRFCKTFESHGFRREAFYPCYGLAEATLLVTGGEREKGPCIRYFSKEALSKGRVILSDEASTGARALVSCGYPRGSQEILVINTATEAQAPKNQIGEICVTGKSVAAGYWKRPTDSERTFRFIPKGSNQTYLRTGDLGFIYDGKLFITGRAKNVIIIGGLNHAAEDLERTIEQAHPMILENGIAAFSVDGIGGEKAVVVAELDRRTARQLKKETAESKALKKDILNAIKTAVSANHDMQLADVSLVAPGTIPRTSSGKIQRHVARNNWLKTCHI